VPQTVDRSASRPADCFQGDSSSRLGPCVLEDGTLVPAERPVLHTAVPNWQAGDTITLGADQMLRVVETRFVDDESVLVVERV